MFTHTSSLCLLGKQGLLSSWTFPSTCCMKMIRNRSALKILTIWWGAKYKHSLLH